MAGPIGDSMANQWILPGVVVLVIGVVVGAMVLNQATADECGSPSNHWHSAYSIWIDGERVPFTSSEYTSPQQSTEEESQGTHIHGNDGVYHFHPYPARLCVSMNEALDYLDVDVDANGVTLGSTNTMEGRHEGNVQVYFQEWSEQVSEWRSVSLDALGATPNDGDAYIILVGDYTDAEIEDIQSRAPVMRGNPNYDPHYGS